MCGDVVDELVAAARNGTSTRHPAIGLAWSDEAGAGFAHSTMAIHAPPDVAPAALARIESALRPRWVTWNNETAAALLGHGIRIARAWDLAAAHRLLVGGWSAEPARIWATVNDRPLSTIPAMGQLGLLDPIGDDGGDRHQPVRPDGHLRPEWVAGGWATSDHLAGWAATALDANHWQQARLRDLAGERAVATARSESTAETLAAELSAEGLPLDLGVLGGLLAAAIGPRPADSAEAEARRRERDDAVLVHAPLGGERDLRNPAHVRSLLRRVGIDVADTRAWRLEAQRDANPFVAALLHWRKVERMATTYGYDWVDHHVGPDGRLRGRWTGSDGGAGRMTAGAGLHSLPGELRRAVVAAPGHRFVRADLGQVEPRVLAAVSGDAAFAAAAATADLYAPVARRLGVARDVAKVAVLAAMYGQRSGTAGQALAGMQRAYPIAMAYLDEAERQGQLGNDVRTDGGRLIRSGDDDTLADLTPDAERRARAGRGRFVRNAMVQGAAAELFKAWAATVRARLWSSGAAIVLCLHDELLVHTPAADAADVAAVVDDALAEAVARWLPVGTDVRFVTETSIVSRWSDAH
ncbi:MAG: DNA polymerase [Desertimonas sp.]